MFVKKRVENCRIGLDSYSYIEFFVWLDMLYKVKCCGDLSIKVV